MLEMEGQIKKWGNSAAIRVSRKEVGRGNLRMNQGVRLLVLPKKNVLKETFGTAKFDKPTDRIMKEIDRMLYNE